MSEVQESPMPAAFSSWRHRDTFLLVLMIVSITAINQLWIGLDSNRLSWDYARHLGNSLLYKDTFSLAHPIRYLEQYAYYPPLMYWVTDLFYVVFGTGLRVAILSNTVFLSILVFATYGIGKRLWSPRVGLLAALFVVTAPLFVTQTRQYMLDVPQAALVAAALYFLLRSENFAERRSSLLFGVACGCGMLIKWTSPFYVILPAAAALISAVVASRREHSADRLYNVAGAAVLALAISAVWYVPNYHEFVADVRLHSGFPASTVDAPPVGSVASALWYFWSLVNVDLYLIPFLFFGAGVVYLFLRNEAASRNMPLLLSLIGAYIALSAISSKDVRYVMPMIPAVAVIAASWLEFLRPTARQWLSRGLIAYSVLAFFLISFGPGTLPREVKIPIPASSLTSDVAIFSPPVTTRVTGIVVFDRHSLFLGAPSDETWHQQEVFEEIAMRGGRNVAFWFTDPYDSIWFNTWDIRYYAYKYHAAWVQSPQAAQFLIIRGPVPPGVTDGFVTIAEYSLPYGGPLRLYQRE